MKSHWISPNEIIPKEGKNLADFLKDEGYSLCKRKCIIYEDGVRLGRIMKDGSVCIDYHVTAMITPLDLIKHLELIEIIYANDISYYESAKREDLVSNLNNYIRQIEIVKKRLNKVPRGKGFNEK